MFKTAGMGDFTVAAPANSSRDQTFSQALLAVAFVFLLCELPVHVICPSLVQEPEVVLSGPPLCWSTACHAERKTMLLDRSESSLKAGGLS